MIWTAKSLGSPSSVPFSSITPRKRWMSGFLVSALTWSTLAAVMPNSSAWIIAKSVQRTMSAHSSSPWRTAGPSGSLEITSGRITWSSALASLTRVA